MGKTATLNLRVNPDVKKDAEEVLTRLGISMSTAINMYLNQITLVQGIPFSIQLPEASESVNADLMTDEELIDTIKKRYKKSLKGNAKDADEVFAELEEKYHIGKV